jgi:ATP-dependent protease HslVU (ClpYQ) ATPase subunit
MGVIQNSLNTMIATVAGSILGAKHIQGQQASLKSAELNELATLSREVPELKNIEQPEAAAETALNEKAVNLIGDNIMNQALKSGTISPAKVKNLTAAKMGLEVAQGKLDEKNIQLQLKQQRFNELSKKYEKELNKGGNK